MKLPLLIRNRIPFLMIVLFPMVASGSDILETEAQLGFGLQLDGVKESAYGEWMPVERNYGTGFEPPSAEDLAGEWAVAHDKDYIYVIIRVKDDTLYFYGDKPSLANHPYHHDMVEFVFDPDFSRGGGVIGVVDKVDDWRIEVLPQHDGSLLTWSKVPANPDGGDPFGAVPIPVEGWEGITLSGADYAGWIVEFRFPKEKYRIRSTDGSAMGMDMVINDDDNGGFIEHHLTWNLTVDTGTNLSTADWGVVRFTGIKTAPVVQVDPEDVWLDGVADPAYGDPQVMERVVPGSALPIDPDNLSAEFRLAHDQEFMFLHIAITDDVLRFHQPASMSDPFLDDSITLFLDTDNSKGSGSLGVVDSLNDWRFEIVPQEDGSILAWPRVSWNPIGEDQLPQLEDGWSGRTLITATGYAVELKIPLAPLGISPSDPLPLGLDLAVSDNDGLGDIQQITWSSLYGPDLNPVIWGELSFSIWLEMIGPLQGTRLGSLNWYFSSWFGWYWAFEESSNWYYSAGLGQWIYVVQSEGEYVFIYNREGGSWMATTASLYPWVWKYSEHRWVDLNTPVPWNSRLYPMTDTGYVREVVDGFQLHDFSKVGYHQGLEPPRPAVTDTVTPVEGDDTATLQAALYQAAGGVLLLGPGTYNLSEQLIVPSNTVMRGSGPDLTYLVMEKRGDTVGKSIVVANRSEGTANGLKRWSSVDGTFTKVTSDLPEGTLVIPVENAGFLQPGDTVLVGIKITDSLRIEYNGTTDYWKETDGFRYLRKVVSIEGNRVTLDEPVMHLLQLRDLPYLTRISYMAEEIGIEDLSLGYLTPDDGLPWEFNQGGGGTGSSYHNSRAVSFGNVVNGWVRNVRTFSPEDNGFHIHSRGIDLAACRWITIADCFVGKPAHRGGGGNGYLITMGYANDILVRNTHTFGGRHDFLLGSFCANIVFTGCSVQEPFAASDTHGPFNHHVLYDNFSITGGVSLGGDAIQSINRGSYSGGVGYTGGDVVYWNVQILESVKTLASDQATLNGAQDFVIGVTRITPGDETSSENRWREGIGKESYLRPQSLYESMKNGGVPIQ